MNRIQELLEHTIDGAVLLLTLCLASFFTPFPWIVLVTYLVVK